MKNINFLQAQIKFGIIMGLLFCSYTILMWLLKLDSIFLNIGQYFDMAIILLPLTIISLAIHIENKRNSITLIKRLTIAIFISSISFIIYDPFLYIYHHFINPEWFVSVLELKERDLKTLQIPQNLINDELLKMKNSNVSQSGVFRLSSLIPSVIIVPVIIALLTLTFIKKSKS